MQEVEYKAKSFEARNLTFLFLLAEECDCKERIYHVYKNQYL
jgi:hypothetical protein